MISAKDTSFGAQMAGGALLIGAVTLKGLKVIEIDMDDVLKAAGGLVALFSPVYISIIVDKIKGGGA
jgi:hypothetical protein